MPTLHDCPSCGGLLPEGRRCCPHCHCRYPKLKSLRLAAAAALSLGAAACNDHHDHEPAFDLAYGPFIGDLSAVDLTTTPDLGEDDGGNPDGGNQ